MFILRKLFVYLLIPFIVLVFSAKTNAYNYEPENLLDLAHKSYNSEGKPYDYMLWDNYGRFERKIMEVGHRILNTNNIQQRMYFYVDWTSKPPNAFARSSDSNITIYSRLLRYIDSDDELAAILAHEISHILQYQSKRKWLAMKLKLRSKKYEHEADINAADLMVKAGYNPLALISLLNKISHEDHWTTRIVDRLFSNQSHPTGSARLEKVYNHIQTNYPGFIAQGYDNIYYVNFLLNREKNEDIYYIQEKYNISVPDYIEKL